MTSEIQEGRKAAEAPEVSVESPGDLSNLPHDDFEVNEEPDTTCGYCSGTGVEEDGFTACPDCDGEGYAWWI